MLGNLDKTIEESYWVGSLRASNQMRFFTQTVLRRTVGEPLVGARNGMDGQAQGLPYMRDDRRRIQNTYGLVIFLDALTLLRYPYGERIIL